MLALGQKPRWVLKRLMRWYWYLVFLNGKAPLATPRMVEEHRKWQRPPRSSHFRDPRPPAHFYRKWYLDIISTVCRYSVHPAQWSIPSYPCWLTNSLTTTLGFQNLTTLTSDHPDHHSHSRPTLPPWPWTKRYPTLSFGSMLKLKLMLTMSWKFTPCKIVLVTTITI